jgi:dienelactone hydrolase
MAIGRVTCYWQDDARLEPLTDDPADKRQLRVDIWYPAQPSSDAAAAAYCSDLAAIEGYLGFERAILGKIKTHTLVAPPLVASGQRLPLAVFSPGNGNNGIQYTAFAEDLVSHGYVVVTVDHPFQSLAIAYPDGHVVTPRNPSPEAKDHETALLQYRQRVAVRVDDMRFVLDQLDRLDRGELDKRFAGRLDLDRVAATGHSLGGVAATAACLEDARFKAAVNMDGHQNSLPFLPDDAGRILAQPFLELTDGNPKPTDKQLAAMKTTREEFEQRIAEQERKVDELMQTIPGGSYRVTIPGIGHQAFSDVALWLPAKLEQPHHRVRIIRDYFRAFLDKTLGGKTDTLFDAKESPYAEVEVRRFAPAAPPDGR